MRGRDDTLLNESVFENRNTLFLRISGAVHQQLEGITYDPHGQDCLVHDVYILLNRTHEVRVWSRVGSGVKEVLELVLSGFEVVKRVLETSDFLDGQFYGSTPPLLCCSSSAV